MINMDLTKLNDEIKNDYILISKSNKFDAKYYIQQYNLDEDIDPILHFLEIGVHKGFNPNPNFDTKFYLNYNKDISMHNINPFVHYILYGFDEHRIPKFLSLDEINKLNFSSLELVEDYLVIYYSNQFDSEYYIQQYNLDEDIDPILHFLEIGVHKGFNPNRHFDISYYTTHNLKAKNSNINPFIYFLKYDNFNFLSLKEYNLEDILSLGLKHSLKGKNGFLFLINDANNEIRQHFDSKYINKFNSKKFLDEYNFKKKLFKDNNIEYYFFDVPDKSVVCKNLLPFQLNNINLKRNVDLINEIIDFKEYLNYSCYYKFDSHINFKGGEILSFLILNHIDNKFNVNEWNNIITTEYQEEKYIRNNDLLYPQNWSYSYKEREHILNQINNDAEIIIKPKTVTSLEIKDEFKFCKKRPSHYFYNPNSYSDKTALIYGDSTFEFFMPYFEFYFRNMFYYWDHSSLNDKLIHYVNPNMIIELRIERFIDNLISPEWVVNKNDIFSQ